MPAPRSAFTLVELVVATAIMGILMTGLASAIVLATGALPDPESPTSATLENASIADQVAEELAGALWIIERTPTAVTFTIADRDGNGLPERIRYAWSGTPGDPLTRQYNDEAEIEVLPAVEALDVGYELQSETEEYPGPPVEGAEETLSSFVPPKDWWAWRIDKDYEQAGQYFIPSLPAEAVSWRVSRVFAYVTDNEPRNEETLVQLRLPNEKGLPTDAVLAELTVHEESLSTSFQWHEFTFSDVPPLPNGEGLCLVLKWFDGGPSMSYMYGPEGSDHIWTDKSDNWVLEEDEGLAHHVYGHVGTPGPNQTATRYYVTGARVTLQGDADPTTQVVTGSKLLNSPEALDAIWETDFTTDPTLDHNGDGQPDWVVRDGADFNVGTVSDGVWTADAKLDTYPGCNFTGLTTVDVRYRNTSLGGDGAVFKIRVDNSNGKHARVFSCLRLQSDGTQTLVVSHQTDDAGTEAPLVVVAGLPGDFVTLRLLFDADLDTASLWVDGEEHGTHRYRRVTPDGMDCATLRASGSTAEFDYVIIRVSE